MTIVEMVGYWEHLMRVNSKMRTPIRSCNLNLCQVQDMTSNRSILEIDVK